MANHSAHNVLPTPELAACAGGHVAAGRGQGTVQVAQAAFRPQRHDGRADHAGQGFLLRLDERLRGVNDPRRAMNEAAAMLGAHLEADRVGYAWIEDDDEHHAVEAEWTAAGMPSRLGRCRLNDFGVLFIGALRQGRAVAFEDALSASLTQGADAAAAFAAIDTMAVIAVPLVKWGRLRACLFVHQRTPRAWTQSEQGLVRDVAERSWVVVERARTEAALRASEQRFHELADNISQFAWTAEAGGWINWYNKRWHDYTGMTLQQMEGWGWTKVHHPDHVDRIVAAFSEVLRTGVPYEGTFPLRSKSGEYRWFLTRVLPIRNDEGDVVRWFGTNTDVTALHEAQAALRDLNETLEGRIEAEVATRLKAEETLRQSQKMEAVGQLTGGIAHDFNNHLQAISGNLEMLQARVAQGRAAEAGRYVSAALASAGRASALTQRLLTFSRKQPLDPKQVNANQLVAGVEEMIRRAVGPAIEVEVVLAAGLWTTVCDAHQLENALLNLAVNARDAMPGGGRLVIETANACLDDAYARQQGDGVVPGRYVSISVADTGAGMAADVAKRAFEPFFTTKPVGQGTGLGLSMLYGFSRQSNGHARIDSEQGRGTTVLLYLPRELGESAERDDGAGGTEQAGACRTVLVVEDDAVVRVLVAEALGDEGYQVLEAQDGPSGLHALRSATRVDLLVADMGLPGMDGRELAAARERRPDLKVLFTSGHSDGAAVGRGVALEPGVALISKPFALASLVTKVRALVEG